MGQDLITGSESVATALKTKVNGDIAELFVLGLLGGTAVNIGDWNMDITPSIDVAHGLTATVFRRVTAFIRNDLDTYFFPLPHFDSSGNLAAWISSIDATYISLTRTTGGQFDDPLYDSTSYNRGWIVINTA